MSWAYTLAAAAFSLLGLVLIIYGYHERAIISATVSIIFVVTNSGEAAKGDV